MFIICRQDIPVVFWANICLVFSPLAGLAGILGIFYMPQIYDMERTALFPLQMKACQ
jgi:hypothetical protein